MTRSIPGFVFACLLGIALLAGTVSAVSITESPDVVQRGQAVTLNIADLADGSSFSIVIGGQFGVTPGQTFTFSTTNFNMPFALNNGQVAARTQGTKSTAFAVKKGDATVQVGNAADASGNFAITKDYEITSGTYDYLTLSGIARKDASQITSSMNLLGTKKGPASSTISFTIDGIDNGEVYLTVLVDGNQALFKKITVGNGIATPAPTTEPTPEPTTETTTVTTTTTQDLGVTGATTVPTESVTATPTLYSLTQETRTAAPVVTPVAFSSADNLVTLTTTGVDYAALMLVPGATAPENWLMVSDAYTIAPQSLVFSSPATISFTVPATAGDYAFFVGSYANGQWSVVPSSAGTSTIDAQVGKVGTYALMAYKPESTIPATTAAGQAPESTTAAAVKSSPKVASIAAEGSAAAASPTKKSPLDPLPVIGAVGLCAVAFLLLRKH